MGSGFNFFTNAYDITPAYGSWQDVDVSSYVPVGATCAILDFHNPNAAGSNKFDCRKNGDTRDDTANGWVAATSHRYAIVELDANRIFEAYIAYSTGTPKLWLVGYGDDNIVMFTPIKDYSTATTGSYVDTDASADIPEGATGVICKMINTSASTQAGMIRANGSSSFLTVSAGLRGNSHVFLLCKLDENRIFEQFIGNVAVDLYIIGYTKAPVTFFVDAIDKSLSATGSWQDIDITSDTEATADGAVFVVVNGATAYQGEMRKNGSTDDRSASADIFPNLRDSILVGLDADQILEGYIENTSVDFYLIGYCKPAGGATYTKTWTTDSLFKKLGITKTAAIDVAFKKPNIQIQRQVDALFKKLDILKTFGADVDFLKKDIVKSFAIDVRFGAAVTYTISRQIDVLFEKLGVTRTFGVDAYFGAVGAVAYTKSFALDVVFAYKVRLPEIWLDEEGKIVLNVSRPYVWVGS